MHLSEARVILKELIFILATVAVLPALVSFYLRSTVLGRDRALEGSGQVLSLVPGLLGQFIRRAFYARVLTSFHRSVIIEFGTLISKADARFDENVYVGPFCLLGLVHIERDVLLGPGVHIPSGSETHGMGDHTIPVREQEGTRRCVVIGAGSWIGSNAVVMDAVGRNSVVGAGAVVTRPVPDNVVVGGVPAQVLHDRTASASR